jgi:hypothetical protein
MKKTYIIPTMETVVIETMTLLAGSNRTFSLFSSSASTNDGEYSSALAPESSGGDGEDW